MYPNLTKLEPKHVPMKMGKGMDVLKSSVFFVHGSKADLISRIVCSGLAKLQNENLKILPKA